MKIAVVTSVLGEAEILRDPLKHFKSVDYFAFVDKRHENIKVWNQLDSYDFTYDKKYKHRRNAKIFKIIPELFIPGYDYYVWHDVSHELIYDPIKLLNTDNNKYSSFILFNHQFRNCVYDEGCKLIKLGYDHKSLIRNQLKYYADLNYPRENGLYELSAFIKNSREGKLASLIWWEIICKYSSRDQLSLPFALWKAKCTISLLDGYANGFNEYGQIGNNPYIPQVRNHVSSGYSQNYIKKIFKKFIG